MSPNLYFAAINSAARYYALIRLSSRELESLQQARTTWEKMASLGYYGTGNAVSDPFRALAQLLARMAALECRDGVHYSDLEEGRFERGLGLVLESAQLTAHRWLPRSVHEVIQQHIDALTDHALGAARPVFDSAGLSSVPIKMLSTLVQNYALAAQCARRLCESRENNVLFDALGSATSGTVGAGSNLYGRFECVSTRLCEALYDMGYECIFTGSAVSVREREHFHQHSATPHDHSEVRASGQSGAIVTAPKRSVRLKRKRKV